MHKSIYKIKLNIIIDLKTNTKLKTHRNKSFLFKTLSILKITIINYLII